MSRKFASQKRKKRKFAGNQFTGKEEVPSSSKSRCKNKDGGTKLTAKTASEEKIASGKRRIHDEEKDEGDQEICDLEDCSGRRLFDVESLASAIEQAAVCKECKEGSLVLREDGRMGLASQMTFQCAHCGEETAFSTDCKTGRFYPVNKTAVFASKLIGRGYAGLSKFCSTLDVPGPMAKRTYEKCSKEIKDAAVLEAKESMSAAAREVRELNNCEDGALADIAITIDGTWMKRGHSSLYGAVFALPWQTGKVLDYAVQSKFCYECNYWENQDERPLVDYQRWKASHICHNNHEGSSNSMEKQGTVDIYSRSIELNQLRYVTMISDGDSKNYQSVLELKPYVDVTIVKEDCVGHVQKRMGRRLRDLKKSYGKRKLEDGKPIGGRDRLTD